jgi:hypothetical protein
MGKDKSPHMLGFSDNNKKLMEQAAALLNSQDWSEAVRLGMVLVIVYSEAYVKGKTGLVFCTPELEASIKNNPAFFAALCQEGVIKWLTPFVLGKSTIPHKENQ